MNLKSLIGRTCTITILLTLVSCGKVTPTPSPSPTAPTASPSPTASPTATPVPSILLITGEDAVHLEPALGDWAQERGWLLDSRSAPDLADWAEAPGLQAVVEVGTGIAEDELANAAPGVLIVTVDHPTAQPGDRLSTVGAPNVRHEQAGFLAGALTGLASQSWVVAAISSGAEYDAVYLAAFEHGVKYSCPRCWPEMMGAWEATAEELLARRVDAVFVLPGAGPLPSSLSTAGVWIVYVGDAPPDVPAERIAGSVIFEPQPLVLSALEGLLAGDGGMVWAYAVEDGGLLYGPLNANAISPGRERILETVWQLLASGELDVGVDPITGEER